MKTYFFPALRFTAISILLFMIAYPLVVRSIALLAPGEGDGVPVVRQHRSVGYALEGQQFTEDRYFQGRPSACGYNAAASAASNKGPSDPAYLRQVMTRIDSFRVHNPTIAVSDIPSELVTASGSGLDPDISPEAAYVQIDRIARVRKEPVAKIKKLVNGQIVSPLFGLFGPRKVNVLQLNLALDQLH